MEKLHRINIFLVTELDEQTCARIGFSSLSYKGAVEMVKQHRGSLAIIPNAGYIVKATE
jgi:hypothetical protein